MRIKKRKNRDKGDAKKKKKTVKHEREIVIISTLKFE